MSRNILMLVPALAFALPFVASQPTMARPLATQAPQTLHGDDDDDDDDDNGGDDLIELHVCFETQIAIDTDDHRAMSCEVVEGPSCFANCSAAAVAPLCLTQLGDGARAGDLAACQEQRAAQCRSQCDSGGAAFCSADQGVKARDGDDDDDDHDDDDDDDNNNGDEVIFIDVEVCIDLLLDLDNL